MMYTDVHVTVVWRSAEGEHGEHLLQAEELPEGHQDVPHVPRPGPQLSQGDEVTPHMCQLIKWMS